MKKAAIVLSNGSVFTGYRIGADCAAAGELVFTTGMCGYIETLSDPSFYGQIVLQTFPLIGNYGMIPADMESPNSVVSGYVVRELCGQPSNFRSSETLDVFLKKAGVPGICGVDTRAITRIIREYGVMNAAIVDDASQADLEHLKAIQVKNAVASVSCKQAYHSPATGEARFTVALLDFGAKANIVRELNRRGCNVHVLPYDTTAEEVLSLKPDGLMLSNGPGDPAENTQVIQEIKKLLGKVPMFGICLGHQLLALANGASTYKLKYGHRGANQPVKDLTTGRVYITSQNHGYAVDGSTLAASGGQVRFINANDHTCEGIDYPAIHAFSVQYHPEACAGPLDSAYLFDRFISMMEVR